MQKANPNNEAELLPCPFCGGEAYYLTPVKEKGTAFETMRVECRKCGAVPFAISVYEGNTYEQKKQAIARQWNRRANNNNDRMDSECRSAVEKSKPIKPIRFTHFDGTKSNMCRSCANILRFRKQKYCYYCGQAILWDDGEDEKVGEFIKKEEQKEDGTKESIHI